MDWFEQITGFRELDYEVTRARLRVVDGRLVSQHSRRAFAVGRLETPSLQELRQRVAAMPIPTEPLRVSVSYGDVRAMHADPANERAVFQVASQFNLLEMTSYSVTPEDGVTRYAWDHTQGPACAIAAGAATIYRNYFALAGDEMGQTSGRQIDCLKGLGEALGNGADGALWAMTNGYVLCTPGGLETIDARLAQCDEAALDELRTMLRIGLHWDAEVTEGTKPDHLVSQVFCSALPVAYNRDPTDPRWARFAVLVLEAAYEATLLAARLNLADRGCRRVFLTRLGGGAFGNDEEWIDAAMARALERSRGSGLDVRLVSYAPASERLSRLAARFTESTPAKGTLGAGTARGSSRDVARALSEQGVLKLRWHDRLEAAPQAIPPGVDLADKVEGMLLGLAVGDALGNTSESMNPRDRHARYGWIDHYLPNRYADGRSVGLPSDDSQLAFRTLEHLIAASRLDPPRLGQALALGRIFGIGQATRQWLAKFSRGEPWYLSGTPAAGNGALMRIAPVLIPHLCNPSPDLWSDTLLAAHLTHADELSNISCLAMIDVLWAAIGTRGALPSGWWLDRWLATCDDLSTGVTYRARNGHPPDFDGTISELLRRYVVPAIHSCLAVDAAGEIWHSGAYLLETVPTVVYILERFAHDPRQAILQAVNCTRDNDTVAAIVGAAVGALHGASALPAEWIDGLTGRTAHDDDHRVFRLVVEAGEAFGYGASTRTRHRASCWSS